MLEGRRLRAILTALLLSSAALFVIGVAKERHDIKRQRARALATAAPQPTKAAPKPTRSAATTTAEPATTTTRTAESGAQHAAEGTASKASKQTDAGSGESAAKRKSEGTSTQATTATSATGESAARLASEQGGESSAHVRPERSTEQVFGINTESIPLVVAAVAVSVLLALALWLAPDLSVLLLAVLGLGIVSAVFDVREAAHQATENRGALEAIAIILASIHLGAALVAALTLRKPGGRTAAAV